MAEMIIRWQRKGGCEGEEGDKGNEVERKGGSDGNEGGSDGNEGGGDDAKDSRTFHLHFHLTAALSSLPAKAFRILLFRN